QPVRTMAAKPSMLLRRSTASAARRIRTERGSSSTLSPERRDELGDVLGVAAHREAQGRAARQLEHQLAGLLLPRLRRGRGYYRHRQKLCLRFGLELEVFGLLVEPVPERAQVHVVLLDELFLLEVAVAEFLDELQPLSGRGVAHPPRLPCAPPRSTTDARTVTPRRPLAHHLRARTAARAGTCRTTIVRQGLDQHVWGVVLISE